jgi:hypothetical protein
MECSSVDLRDNGMDWIVGPGRRRSRGGRFETRPVWLGLLFVRTSEPVSNVPGKCPGNIPCGLSSESNGLLGINLRSYVQ